MANKRDDFSLSIKELLANRVGRRCSNPICRKITCGANDDPKKFTNIGVASHICAAAKGGPRYDENMTQEERKSFENGIWLCQSCSKLIDSDTIRYSRPVLDSWKKIAEDQTSFELESASPVEIADQDKKLIMFYIQCFDRPAFKDHISQEGQMEDFDKAIEDTIIALNTGVLRTRTGEMLKQSEGKSAVQNLLWREKLDAIVNKLVSIRRRLKIAKDEEAYTTHGTGEAVFYVFFDRELGEWFNLAREEILKTMSTICREAGLPELQFPRTSYRW